MPISPETFALFEGIEILCEHLKDSELLYEARLRDLVSEETSAEEIAGEVIVFLQDRLKESGLEKIPFEGSAIIEIKRCKTFAYSIQKEWSRLMDESRLVVLPRIARRFLSRCAHVFYRFARVAKEVDETDETPRFLHVILELVRECKDIIQTPQDEQNLSGDGSQHRVGNDTGLQQQQQQQSQNSNEFRASTPSGRSVSSESQQEKLEKTIKEITEKFTENLRLTVADVINQSLANRPPVQPVQQPNGQIFEQQAQQLGNEVYSHQARGFNSMNQASQPMLTVRDPMQMSNRHNQRFGTEEYSNNGYDRNFNVQSYGRNPLTTKNIVQTIRGWKIDFNGTDKAMSYEHYVGCLKHFKATLNLSDVDLMSHIMLTLSGSVRSWYLSLNREEIDRMSLEAFLIELRKRFTTTRTKVEISIELMQTQYNPKTPISNFIDDMNLKLSSQSYTWTIEEKIVIIAGTLPNRIQQFVASREFDSIETFRTYCDKIHSKIEPVLKTKKTNKIDCDEIFTIDQDSDEESYDVDAVGNQRPNTFNKNSQYKSNNNSTSNSNSNPNGYRNQQKRPNDAKYNSSQPKNSGTPQETEKYGYDQNGRRYFKQKPPSGCFICGDESHRRYACMVIPPFNCCYSCGERNVTMYTCKNPVCVEKCKAKQSKN